MQMCAGGKARGSHGADRVTLFDLFAARHFHGGKVPIESDQPVAVINSDPSSIAVFAHIASCLDGAVRNSQDVIIFA